MADEPTPEVQDNAEGVNNGVNLNQLGELLEGQRNLQQTQQSQQETLDYLIQYIERVEAQLNDRLDTLEQNGIGAGAPPMGDMGGDPGAGQQPQGPDPIDWMTLSGQARIDAWNELSSFVEGLVFRYTLQLEIMPCWWQHGEAVEELTSLWQARQVAYAPGADAAMASWWQDLLERSRIRLRGIFTSCRDGHIPAGNQNWMPETQRRMFQQAIQYEAQQFPG